MGVWCTVTEVGPQETALARWSLRGVGPPCLEVVDDLARRQLAARRAGGRLLLTQVSAELAGLIEVAGLRRELLEGSDAPIDD